MDLLLLRLLFKASFVRLAASVESVVMDLSVAQKNSIKSTIKHYCSLILKNSLGWAGAGI